MFATIGVDCTVVDLAWGLAAAAVAIVLFPEGGRLSGFLDQLAPSPKKKTLWPSLWWAPVKEETDRSTMNHKRCQKSSVRPS